MSERNEMYMNMAPFFSLHGGGFVRGKDGDGRGDSEAVVGEKGRDGGNGIGYGNIRQKGHILGGDGKWE